MKFVTKHQEPAQGIVPEKYEEFLRAYNLSKNDQPLSGTDPVGRFIVEWIALDGPLKLLGGLASKGLTKLAAKGKLKRLYEFIGGHKSGQEIVYKNLSPSQKDQADVLVKQGYDLSKFSVEDLEAMIKLRESEILSRTEGRANIVTKDSPNSYYIDDFTFTKDGAIQNGVGMLSNSDNQLHVSLLQSYNTGNGKVAERIYNTGADMSEKLGYDGVISGEKLLSAPKTYKTWSHFDTKIISEKGRHSNIRMVDSYLPEIGVKSEKELIDATKQGIPAATINGRVVKITKPSSLPTQVEYRMLFPEIVNTIDVNYPNLYKGLIIPVVYDSNTRQ